MKVALNETEMANLVKWVASCESHPNSPKFEIEEIPTGIGIKVVVRELRSRQECDVTDYRCW